MMRFLQYINEEYELISQNGVVIFTNPDSKEMKEATDNPYNRCRFIINFKTKKLYIWDGSSVIHTTVAVLLYGKGLLPFNDMYGNQLVRNCTLGVAKRVGKKLEYKGCYEGCDNFYAMNWTTDGTDDQWLKGFFNKPFIETFIDKHKREL